MKIIQGYTLKGYIQAVLFFFSLVLLPLAAMAQPSMTAKQAFIQLPPDIFLYTNQEISDESKMLLIDNGSIKNWAISYIDDDSLDALTLQGDYGAVFLRLYRKEEGGIVAYGAKSNEGCSVEFWNYDAFGGFVPNASLLYDDADSSETHIPQLAISDFFTKKVSLPAGAQPVFYLCLESKGLYGQVHFIQEGERLDIPLDNEVWYTWDGKQFIKQKRAKAK